MKILSVIETINILEDKIKTKQGFIFNRYGDGDLKVMQGLNDKLHVANKKFSNELKESFLINDNNYLKAVTGNYPVEDKMEKGLFLPFNKSNEYEQFVTSINSNQLEYLNPIVFHYLYIFDRKRLQSFINNLIQSKTILFIGCFDSKLLKDLFGKVHYQIWCKENNSYNDIENIWNKLDFWHHDFDIIIPCAGLTSRVLNKRLYKSGRFKGISIDFGSIVDCEANLRTRTWIKIYHDKIKSNAKTTTNTYN